MRPPRMKIDDCASLATRGSESLDEDEGIAV
jgi:hypothetical protein